MINKKKKSDLLIMNENIVSISNNLPEFIEVKIVKHTSNKIKIIVNLINNNEK